MRPQKIMTIMSAVDRMNLFFRYISKSLLSLLLLSFCIEKLSFLIFDLSVQIPYSEVQENNPLITSRQLACLYPGLANSIHLQ